MKKAILLFLLCCASLQLFAQADDLKARVEFDAAEQAYRSGDYPSVVSHLNSAESLLGSWNAKIGYLRIVALDKMISQRNGDSRSVELRAELQKYMAYANDNQESVDKQKFSEVYSIEQKLAGAFNEEKADAAYQAGNYKEAFSLYKKAADKGIDKAMYSVAQMYKNGKGTAQNDAEAFSWYKRAAEKGHREAMYELGLRYARGEGVAKNGREALAWLNKAADKGVADAMLILGDQEHQGKSYKKALEWYEKGGMAGNVECMFRAGYVYYYGEYINRGYSLPGDPSVEEQERIQYPNALKWLKKAGEKGSVDAMLILGVMYHVGKGTAVNYSEAANWYIKAMDAGVNKHEVMTGLAYCYEGLGEYGKALDWWKKAYANGDNSAKDKIVQYYREGKGVEKDKKMAKEWENK